MRILHLYRPRLPSLRAQAIQVTHACHALVAAGHEVTLLADRGGPGGPEEALSALGLTGLPGLSLRICPWVHKGLSGLWFRAQLSAWWAGAPGWVLARDKRRLRGALRYLGGRHRILLETHELDSALAAERGDEATALSWRALEAELLPRCDVLVANCGGTLAAWEAAHGGLMPTRRRASHNAVSASRERALHPQPDAVIRCVGSLRSYKGIADLIAAAEGLPLPLELVGGSAAERAALPPGAPVRLREPVPYPEVPDLLCRSRALLLPLKDNLFGRSLTSPLKLWDYLATAAPIIAPALPSIREIADLTGAPIHFYPPGDAAGLAAAAHRALAAPPRQPHVRTWSVRAAELLALMEER
jgi:glycosyltransferase involved in cell wall biosynthesis